jgi:hypothetical protein
MFKEIRRGADLKLSKTFKIILFVVLVSAFGTGTLWYIFEKWIRITGPLGPDHHPAQEILLRIHGIIAYATLLCLGFLIRAHIQPGLKGKRSKKSGLSMMFVFGFLILTALIQLYGPDSAFRDNSGLLHFYVGLSLPVLLGVHLIKR